MFLTEHTKLCNCCMANKEGKRKKKKFKKEKRICVVSNLFSWSEAIVMWFSLGNGDSKNCKIWDLCTKLSYRIAV